MCLSWQPMSIGKRESEREQCAVHVNVFCTPLLFASVRPTKDHGQGQGQGVKRQFVRCSLLGSTSRTLASLYLAHAHSKYLAVVALITERIPHV